MNNKKILMIAALSVAIIVLFGIGYAFFIYNVVGEKNNELLAGEIYLNFNEGTRVLNLQTAFPMTEEEALKRDDNYITFTLSGKNTYKKKDIYYEIKLNYGDDISGKTRYNDEHIRFEFKETKDGVTKTIFSNYTFSELNDTRIWVNTIDRNTTEEIEITYQLRMWISDEVLISDTSPDATYTTGEFARGFASVKISVYGDLVEKSIEVPKNLYETIETTLASYLLADDGDARIVSGTEEELTNNYVWYSGKMWRIVALNNDGSVKLVTDKSMTAIAYADYEAPYESSFVYQWLNEDFLDTLYNYENLLVTNYKWNATLMADASKPEETTMVQGIVGLLNLYEYGASYSIISRTSYLNTGYYWWLLTPYHEINVFADRWYAVADESMHPIASIMGIVPMGVRPSINLKSNIQVIGEGTNKKPYRIVGDVEKSMTNGLLNERLSGEYVSFDNELYRIVSIENDITKITKVDYIRDSNNNVVIKDFASTTYFGAEGNEESDNYWDYYLNNIWYNSISDDYRNMIVDGTYYLGGGTAGINYKDTICAISDTTETTKICQKTNSKYEGKVGLGRIGELFTNQLGDGYTNSSDIWTITPYIGYNSVEVFRVFNYDYAYNVKIDESEDNGDGGARPSMFLSSSVYITGGTGLPDDPFQIAMN